MATYNLTLSGPSTFILNGISDLEAAYVWISVPFATFYILSLLGNFIVVFVVSKEQTLHKPMYLLLCMLALTDISLSTLFVSNTLSLFWFHLRKITVHSCLTQVYVFNAIGVMNSAVLVTMAFDRYVAICEPLRYTTILTNARIAKLGLMGFIRAVLLLLPQLYFLQKLTSCANYVIPNFYCEFITSVTMACANTAMGWIYSLLVPLVTIMLDLTIIVLSYVPIIRTVLRISSKKAHQKALSTCTTHIFIMLIFYSTFLFIVLSQRFGMALLTHIHIILGNLCFYLPPVLKPIIYGIRTKELQDKLGKYVCGI